MSYDPKKDVIDLRSPSIESSLAHDRFVETFMKPEKTANEAAATPTSDVETVGSTETNIDNEVATVANTQRNEKEQKGIPQPSYLWGEEPPKDQPGTSNRTPGSETLSTSAEQINLEDNLDLLSNAFSNFGEASRVSKATVSQLFQNGQPGKYIARTQTLLEKVKGTAGRS
jgi:hypothetical protein